MNHKFNSIRLSYIRSHLISLFLIIISLLSILLFIQVLFQPNWLNLISLSIYFSLLIVVGLMVSTYVGFKSSSQTKEQLDNLSVLISQYENGNYQSRIYFQERDEISRIGSELNNLGEKLQNQVKSLQRMADEKAELAKSAHKAATMEERHRLARDLHDSVSQQLFGLTMLAEAATYQIEKDPKLAKKQLENITNASLVAQSEMRALLLHLRPIYLSGDSLVEGIHKLISELEEKTQINFDMKLDENLNISQAKEEHVFRIIQEALSNVLRHADATEVQLEITLRDFEIFIYVRDNGKGFDINERSNQKASYGLTTMKERSEEIGGIFDIRSNVGKGTYIIIRIPFTEGEVVKNDSRSSR